MNNQLPKLKKRKSKFLQTVKAKWRTKQFLGGVVIGLLIITAPFTYHIYLNAPATENTPWDLGVFTIYSGGYLTVQGFLYNFFTKFYIFTILSIWFLTCKYWWKYSILVPLTLCLFQLSSVINDNIEYVDQFEFVDSLPVVIPVIIFQILIARKLNSSKTTLDLKEQIEAELESFINEN